MGDSEELRAGEYRITWKAVKAARIDTTALKKALPIHPRDSDPPFLRGVTPRSCQFTRVGKNFRV